MKRLSKSVSFSVVAEEVRYVSSRWIWFGSGEISHVAVGPAAHPRSLSLPALHREM